MAVQPLTDDTFESVIGPDSGLVFVDFFATWCKPCQEVLKGIDRFAADVEQNARVFKMDTDVNYKTAKAFAIRDLPTVILFSNGIEVERVTDYIDNTDLFATLKEFVTE